MKKRKLAVGIAAGCAEQESVHMVKRKQGFAAVESAVDHTVQNLANIVKTLQELAVESAAGRIGRSHWLEHLRNDLGQYLVERQVHGREPVVGFPCLYLGCDMLASIHVKDIRSTDRLAYRRSYGVDSERGTLQTSNPQWLH